MVDPGDWLPLIGVAMLAVTTLGSILGAYAVGRARRVAREEKRIEHPERARVDRLERIEQMLETMSEEMERLSESQRFLVKVMGDKQLPRAAESVKPPPRVITPH
jgi:hypothetical protein